MDGQRLRIGGAQVVDFGLASSIKKMADVKILPDPQYPKPWKLWYYSRIRSCRISNSRGSRKWAALMLRNIRLSILSAEYLPTRGPKPERP